MIIIGPTEDEQARKRKVLDELQDSRANLLGFHPFTGALLMRLELVPILDDRCRTAATDGQRIFMSIDFYDSLSEAEVLFVLAHELWHCALQHIGRCGAREHERWNLAIDQETNAMLVGEGMKLPRGAFYLQELARDDSGKLVHQNAEEIYETFIKDQEIQVSLAGFLHAGSPIRDDHLDNTSSNAPVPEVPGDDDGLVFHYDPDYDPLIDTDALREWTKAVITQAQVQSRMNGNLPGHLQTMLEKLREPTIDWRRTLASWLTAVFHGDEETWIPPDRRLVHRGLWFPGSEGHRLEVAVAIDTSASTHDDLPAFLNELHGICSSYDDYRIQVIQCDCKVQAVHEFSPDNPISTKGFAFKGQGGTDFRPAFQYVATHFRDVSGLIYVTDGFGTPPEEEPDMPVLWLMTHWGKVPCSWGTATWLKEEKKGGHL